MSDHPGDPIRRVDDLGDRVRVVTKSWSDLNNPWKLNTLTQEYGDLFIAFDGPDTVRVGSATHAAETEGYHIHGVNGIYAEVSLIERDLTDDERTWVDESLQHLGHQCPESVVEFEIPHPEDLRSAILDQELNRFDCLDAVIADADHRHRVLTTLQESIEEQNFRARKLSSRKGYPIDLPPEWDPEHDHNDDRDRDHLNDMASMRKDAHLVDFDPVAGFGYNAFKQARERILGVHEPDLDEYYDLVALDVVDAEDWIYCRNCAAVAPEERFLHVQKRGYDEGRTMRVCDDCAAYIGESDVLGRFTEDAVAKSKDERAQRLGGQRRIGGDYGG